MKIFTTRDELSNYLSRLRKSTDIIGFVPTMGALHTGHIALIKAAGAQSDIVVCSIFVNPTQFNDPLDFEKYPKTIREDIQKLEKSGCDILFLPAIDEMYPKKEKWTIDLGSLDEILEAKSRKGHYQGVTQIVNKLLNIVKPDRAYFGQKDFQQFLVISRMIRMMRIPVKLVCCPIVRDKDGLALSSRNIRLSEAERKQAIALSQALTLTVNNFDKKTIAGLKTDAVSFLNSRGIEPDYFEICHARNLKPAARKGGADMIALVAAYVGSTRLIDNMILPHT